MSAHAVLAAVRELAPVLRERAAEAEELRRVPDVSVKEIAETGFFRLTQPTAFGGLAADPVVFYGAVKDISAACGSTGWVASVLGVHSWHMARFDPAAQEEVWGADRTARIASSYAPNGTVTPVDGGHRLSGRWPLSSGCDHADWALLGGLVRGADGTPTGRRTFLVPRSAYSVDPVWDAVGLRGTGSNDIVVEDAFVPPHRTLGVVEAGTRGRRPNPEPLYRLPYAAVIGTGVSAPVVGIAEGAYAAYVEAAGRRLRDPAAENPSTEVRIARAASDIDAGWLQLTRNMGELYDHARRGEDPPTHLRARTRRDQVLATERCVAAVDALMGSTGAGAMRTGPDPVQRAWRDVHTARGHIANRVEPALALFGRAALGLGVQDTTML